MEQIPDPSLTGEMLTELLPAFVAGGVKDQINAKVADEERRAARLSDPAAQAETLAGLALALAAAGSRDESLALLRRARMAAREVENSGRRAQTLCRLVNATASVGDLARAEELSQQIDDLGWRDQAIAGLVSSAADAGEHDRARRLIGTIANTVWRREAEVSAVAANVGGDYLVGEPSDGRWRAQFALESMRHRAEAGDQAAAVAMADTVEQLARAIPEADSRAETLGELAMVMGSLGSSAATERALLLTREIPNPASRLRALTGLAARLAATGDRSQVSALVGEAEQLARQGPDLWRTQAAIRTVAALVDIGATEHALRLAPFAEQAAIQLPEPAWRAKACTELIGPIAAAGDPTRALRIAVAAESAAKMTPNQVQALTQLIAPVAAAGNPRHARKLATDVERLAVKIPNDGWRAQSLAQLASALLAVGDIDETLRVAKKITIDELRAQVLSDATLQLLRDRRDTAAGNARQHVSVARRMVADVLCTPHWTQALPIVGQLDPGALHQLSTELRSPGGVAEQ